MKIEVVLEPLILWPEPKRYWKKVKLLFEN